MEDSFPMDEVRVGWGGSGSNANNGSSSGSSLLAVRVSNRTWGYICSLGLGTGPCPRRNPLGSFCGFSGSDSILPSLGAQVRPLVREIRSRALWPKKKQKEEKKSTTPTTQ